MKFYEALAIAFSAEGTTDVFGMTAESNIYWQASLEKLGGRMYQVRHEGGGLAMADGWARMTGTPGVCTTTGGPGAAQLATTMIVASRARTPLVAFCGDTATGDLSDAQYLDQAKFAAGIEAGFVRISNADDAYQCVQRAFYLARTESRPIVLNVPVELTHQEIDEYDDYVPSTALLAKTRPVHPNPAAIAQATDIIGNSQRPVIIVGRGAMFSGASQEILELAERTGAVIATTLMAKNWLGDYAYHVGVTGLFATRTAIEIFAEADCVIAFGASLNRYTTEHGFLYPNATFVHVDNQAHVVMGDGRAADCYVHADAKLGAEALNASLDDQSFKNAGYHTPEVLERVSHGLEDPREYPIAPGTIDPRVAVRTLDDAMPADIGMVLGGGHQNHFGIMLADKQRSWLLPNLHFACIGQGLTTAMGAVIAKGTPAFLMEGDAGFMMHMPEFETAVRYDIPVFVACFNDQGYGAEYHHYFDKEGVNIDIVKIPTPDLGKVGVALGGHGSLATTPEELRAAADRFVAAPSPTLVDVRISGDVVSIPNRRRYRGEEDE